MKYNDKIVVQTYIPNDIYIELKKEADDNFMSLSAFLRSLIIKRYNSDRSRHETNQQRA